MSTDLVSLREQVKRQYRAVAYLAKALSGVHVDLTDMLNEPGPHDRLLEMMGARSAYFMEVLGNALNEMDAVQIGNDWLDPIFAEAQRRWPSDKIADAPELLETAKVWLRLHEQGMANREAAAEMWNSGQIPRAMEAIRAAIAKAEGRS